MRESSIASTAGQLLRCLQAAEWKFLSCCPSSLAPILSADLLSYSSRKAILRAVSSGFQAQWRSPSCSDPRRQLGRCLTEWLTPNSTSPKLPFLIHTTQTLGWLDNMDLHSQQDTFSSQPSGNLDTVSCCFLREPLDERGWGLRLAWMQGMCSLFDAQNRPWSFKGIERVRITLRFFRDFALQIWLEKKDRNTGQGWPSLGLSWLWVEFQPTGFRVTFWCHSQAIIEEGIEERDFEQRAVWSEGHGNHTGQDETRVITCFFALSVPCSFYPWGQIHRDNQKHWWCPWHLMLLMITSLYTCPWDQSLSALWLPQVLPSWEGWHASLLVAHNWSMGWSHGGWPVDQISSMEGRLAVKGKPFIKLGYLGP